MCLLGKDWWPPYRNVPSSGMDPGWPAPGQGAVGSVAAAPVVGSPMLLALYSVLTYILYAYGLVWGVCIASCI